MFNSVISSNSSYLVQQAWFELPHSSKAGSAYSKDDWLRSFFANYWWFMDKIHWTVSLNTRCMSLRHIDWAFKIIYPLDNISALYVLLKHVAGTNRFNKNAHRIIIRPLWIQSDTQFFLFTFFLGLSFLTQFCVRSLSLFLPSPPLCLFVRVDKIRFSFMLYHKSPIKSFLCAQSCKSAVLIALSLGQRVQNSGTFRRWIYLTLLYPVPGHPLYLLSLSLRSPSHWLVSTPVFSRIVVCSLKLTFFSPICLHSVFLQHHFHFSCTLFLDCRFSHPLPSLPSCCPAFQILVPSYHSLPSSSVRDGLETPHHSVIPLPLL